MSLMAAALQHASVATRWGRFACAWSGRGLVRIAFPGERGARGRARGEAAPAWLARPIRDFVAGRAREIRVPLDVRATPFTARVLAALLRIPYGETRTYAEVARAIGAPRAARAVGAACARNPVPIAVPCHRVVAAGGGEGGFSAGLRWKRRLLAVEARELAAARRRR